MKDQRPDGRDVDRIREMLERAAPQDSRALGRADAVVRRGRRARTRHGVVGAVAVAVAAAAVIVGPQFVDSSPVTNEATNPTNSATTTPSNPAAPVSRDPYANPCPNTPVVVSSMVGNVALRLESDVAMIRLCRARVEGWLSSPWDPPADALVTGLDSFAAQLAELPAADPDPCPAARPTPQPFALQIIGSAGATQTLGSALTACGVVTVNSKLVSAEALLDVFKQALTEQRGALEPQVTDTTLECRDTRPFVRLGWMSDVTTDTSFVAAIQCPRTSEGDAVPPDPASDAAIELLNQAWAANARDLRTVKPVHVDLCPTAFILPTPTFVMTSWGDVVAMRMVACGNYRLGPFQFLPSLELITAMSLPYIPQ